MTQKAYVVPLRDLDDGPKTLRQGVSDAWLAAQLGDAGVAPAGKDDGALDVTLTKNGRDVLVRGRLAVSVQVPCARTLDPAVYRVTPEVFLLLGPKAGSTSEGSGQRGRKGQEAGRETRRGPAGKEGRPVAKAAGGNWEDDGLLDDEDAARDTYSGDLVVLDDFLREFILLEIPMVPLREDLRKAPFEATPSPPGSPSAGDSSRTEAGLPQEVDPRLSPLVALKARLEKKE